MPFYDKQYKSICQIIIKYNRMFFREIGGSYSCENLSQRWPLIREGGRRRRKPLLPSSRVEVTAEALSMEI